MHRLTLFDEARGVMFPSVASDAAVRMPEQLVPARLAMQRGSSDPSVLGAA